MVIDKKYIDLFTNVTARAAYGASLYKGKNDKIGADQAAVDQMRSELNKLDIRGKVVIGEGEMDEAPMLYIGEEVGNKSGPEVDIAVDPLEGTNFAAKNLPNALAVMAVSNKGNLLQAPDIYMEKIAIGKNLPQNLLDLDNTVEKNIKLLSDAKGVNPNMLTACLLKRKRHDNIIKSLEAMKVNIKFLTDGDVSGVLFVAEKNKNVDIYLGIGGGPEGVLAAAALSCLDCQMQTRLVYENKEQMNKAKKLGISDLEKKYSIDEMVKGDVIFCASGVTNGDFVNGIKEVGNFFESETLALHKSSNFYKVIKKKLNKGLNK